MIHEEWEEVKILGEKKKEGEGDNMKEESKKTAKDVAKKYGDIENLKNATKEELIQIDDVGEVIADGIYKFFSDPANVSEIEKLYAAGVKPIYENSVTGGVFGGEKVVLTGTLSEFKRDEAAAIIEKLGGEIMSGVSKNTTLVVAGESAGSKLDKAKALGIKIIDEEMFKFMIKS